MLTFAEKQKASRGPRPAAAHLPAPGRFGQGPEVQSILRRPPGTAAPVRRQAAAGDSGGAAPPSVAAALREPGRPLDAETRSFMEPRFGQDLSGVRVHSGASAEQSARDVNAQAYTLGHDIVLGADAPAPGTPEGRRLMAHELAHTVQQTRGAPAVIARAPKPPAPPPPPPPPPFVFSNADMGELRNRMLAFYNMLTPTHRGSLHRNTTVVFAVVTAADGFPTLGYTVASNSTNPSIRSAAEALGFTRLDPEGVPKIAGEAHAEQLMLESARKLGFRVHGMVVSRAPCQDCGPVVANAGIPIQWVPDPNPPPRTQGGGTGGAPPGTPPPPPPGGGPGPGPTGGPGTGKGAAAPKGQTLTAEVGPKLQPVNEATPGFNPGRGQAVGGAIQQIQSRQVSGLQQDEVDKFQKRYAELQPKIAGFLAKGQSVELTLIVEKPDRPDVLCAGKVFCDQGQITYFRSLYISRVLDPIVVRKWTPPTRHATLGPAGGRDSFIPYTHQGGSIIDEKEIPHLKTGHRDYHTEYKKMTLDPQPQFNFTPARPAPRPQPPPEQPKPMLDWAAKRRLAAAPATVYLLSEHMGQFRTAVLVMKKLEGNNLFGELKERMGGFQGRTRTVVSYNSEYDRAKADALVEIVRSLGVATVRAELNSGGNDTPGTISIWFGQDASREQ